MADFFAPKKGVAFSFVASVGSQATSGTFQIDPTIAAGDFKISKDGGALANLTNLPAVSPAGSSLISFALTLTEMNADNVTIQGKDAAGAEWFDVTISIQTSTNATADLALQTTAAAVKTKTDFLPSATAGAAGGVFVAGSNAATTVNITGTLSTVTTLTNLPAITAGWLTATGIASDAITSAKFAAGTAIPRVTLADTLTTYTGNTVQTGDSFVRIGAAGAGLSNLVLPSGGLANVIAWTVALTGNLSGSVGSVSGAVGSVAGNVGGNVAGSVGSVASGGISASSIAASALNGKGDWNIGKTGYTLSQSFPSNFSSFAVTAGGAITAGTVSDKTGYSLATTPPTAAAIAAAVRDVSNATPAAGSLGEAVNNADDGSAPTAAANAAAVWDELLAGHVISGSAAAMVVAINGKTQAISSGVFTLVSPIATSGTITLFRGDDYFNADGAALTFTSSTFPTLTAATILLKISNGTNFTGVVTSATSVYFEITRAQTAALTSPEYHYEVEATLADGHVRTIATGALHMDD